MLKSTGKKQALLFVNKKKQKNFESFGPRVFQNPGFRITKVFCAAFFQKKRLLASLRQPQHILI
jgi:hypothetical protein